MVAVLSLGAGPGATGFLTALQSLPFLLLSFPAGVLADRFSRRRLMTLAELCRVVALLALPGLMLLGSLNIGGRLAAIVGDEPVMRANFITRTSEGQWDTVQPWDTVAPRLLNFPEPSRFNF